MANFSNSLLRASAALSAMALLTACPVPPLVLAPAPGTNPAAATAPNAQPTTSGTAPGTPSATPGAAGGATVSPTATPPGAPTPSATPTPAVIVTPIPTPSPTASPRSTSNRRRATPPPASLSGLYPTNGSVAFGVNGSITATFDTDMTAATIDDTTFLLDGPGPGFAAVDGVVTYDALTRTATFDPDVNLTANSDYRARLTTGILDAAGRATYATEATFTTGADSILSARLLNYAVLAGTTVTNGGPSSVAGHLGLSPGSAVTGFDGAGGPGFVVAPGVRHVTDTDAAAAKLDLTAAYNDLAGRSVDPNDGVTAPITLNGEIGRGPLFALIPGLYQSNAGYEITGADLHLDGGVSPATAIYIFQMATTLTAATTRTIVLNGVDPANIYWQVGQSATLENSSAFYGSVLAEAAITMNTSSTITGRLLVRSGAVNLNATTITLP